MSIIVRTPVPLSNGLLKRIQAKSDMPALEGFEGILTRILDQHDMAYPDSQQVILAGSAPYEPTHFKTQRGFKLPVGLELFSNWNGNKIKAKVTFSGIEYKGKTYEVSPSAYAAKKDHGATDTQASTNGWKFWQFKNDNGEEHFIDTFRAP